MSLKPICRSLGATTPLALMALLAACTTLPEQMQPPKPATLAAVRSLAPHACNETTAMALDGLGVPPDRIKSITYDRRTTGTRSILTGYDAWVEMQDHNGDMVIRHNRTCKFMTSYEQA